MNPRPAHLGGRPETPVITFNAPHVGKGAWQGAFPSGIVQGGLAMAYYID
jgi:hypothetical protein